MEKSIAVIVAVGCLVLLLKALTGGGGGKGAPKPVAKRFLTAREAAMLEILEGLMPHCRFHAQVAMGALLDAPRIAGKRRLPSDRNAFASKIVDFVAQDRATGELLALIEVDDSSHQAEKDRSRDAMTSGAGYRTVRIGREVAPKVDQVRHAIAGLLVRKDAPAIDAFGRVAADFG